MKNPSSMSQTQILVEAALMLALSLVLSIIPFFSMPQGGSVSLCSCVPLVIMSLRHNAKWGLGTAAAFGFIKMFLGLQNVFLLKTLGPMVLCALLDYVLAYTFVGLSGIIAKRFKNITLGIVVGVFVSACLRLLCSFLSGVLLFSAYAPAGTPVWIYSLLYNIPWCFVDSGLTLIATLAICKIPFLNIIPKDTAQQLA